MRELVLLSVCNYPFLLYNNSTVFGVFVCICVRVHTYMHAYVRACMCERRGSSLNDKAEGGETEIRYFSE